MRQLAKDFSRTKDFVASSAAALVSEAVYKSNQPNKSTAILKNCHFSFLLLS
jgi:cell division inhibitor SulA